MPTSQNGVWEPVWSLRVKAKFPSPAGRSPQRDWNSSREVRERVRVGVSDIVDGIKSPFFTFAALTPVLSHREREQMAENHNNGRISVIRFPLSVGKRTNCRESQQSLNFSYPIPSLRGRGLGRGQSRLERRYPDFQKNTLQNGYRQKRWSGMDVRPCSLISKV